MSFSSSTGIFFSFSLMFNPLHFFLNHYTNKRHNWCSAGRFTQTRSHMQQAVSEGTDHDSGHDTRLIERLSALTPSLSLSRQPIPFLARCQMGL